MTTASVLELRAIERTYKTSAGALRVLRGTDLKIAPENSWASSGRRARKINPVAHGGPA